MAGRLTDAGIKSFVFVERIASPYLPDGPAHVIVHAEDEEMARRLLE